MKTGCPQRARHCSRLPVFLSNVVAKTETVQVTKENREQINLSLYVST